MQSILINRPDDWHVHLRDQDALQHTVPATAKHFYRALIMPNLKPALTTVSSVIAYRERILQCLDDNLKFIPYMTLYLNESISEDTLEQAAQNPFILGAKLYPAGVTTNSEAGAQSIQALYPLLEIMQEKDLVLQVHGEVSHGDIFDREAIFLNECLRPLVRNFPKLRVVLEHISTAESVEFVKQHSPQVAATITPHHLLLNRNQLLSGGIRPHYYCLPILKSARDQEAIQQAAISGSEQFFAGTDSAPHDQRFKENACGCAGVYSAPFAVSLYAQLFDRFEKMNRLNNFMSRFGAQFYRLPASSDTIELRKSPQVVPSKLPLGLGSVIPLFAGETLPWSIHETK